MPRPKPRVIKKPTKPTKPKIPPFKSSR